MVDDTEQPTNPYDPPQVETSLCADTPFTFGPRVLPRDLVDVVVGILLGLSGCCLLYGVPMLVAYRLGFEPVLPVFVVLFATVVIALHGIRKLSFNDSGIMLKRTLGSPRFVPWSEIIGIREASRTEIVVRSLLFPHQCCTVCMSCRQHYCIEWNGGHFYFPPRDPKTFIEAFDHFRFLPFR